MKGYSARKYNGNTEKRGLRALANGGRGADITIWISPKLRQNVQVPMPSDRRFAALDVIGGVDHNWWTTTLIVLRDPFVSASLCGSGLPRLKPGSLARSVHRIQRRLEFPACKHAFSVFPVAEHTDECRGHGNQHQDGRGSHGERGVYAAELSQARLDLRVNRRCQRRVGPDKDDPQGHPNDQTPGEGDNLSNGRHRSTGAWKHVAAPCTLDRWAGVGSQQQIQE